MITFDFYNQTKAKVSKKIFEKLLARTHAVLVRDRMITKRQKFFCELTLVGDKTIRALNKIYHHKDRPTDVISLSFFDKKMKDSYIGEIFISVPYAKRQAKKIGQSLHEELRFLFTHGLLHLFGYDHKKTKEETHMLNLTYKILDRAIYRPN